MTPEDKTPLQEFLAERARHWAIKEYRENPPTQREVAKYLKLTPDSWDLLLDTAYLAATAPREIVRLELPEGGERRIGRRKGVGNRTPEERIRHEQVRRMKLAEERKRAAERRAARVMTIQERQERKERIKEALAMGEMNSVQIAELFDVSTAYVSLVRNGKR